jgi:hypothetical protein
LLCGWKSTLVICVSATGAVTVTVNWQLALNPPTSVAVQLTVLMPMGKKLPDAGTQVVVTPGQLSVAVTVKLTVAPSRLSVLVTVMLAEQVIAGG